MLDLSASGLELAGGSLGDRGDRVEWIAADLLEWTPSRRYGLWHDRAVLHFFTHQHDRAACAKRVHQAVAPGGFVVIATFAPDGPTTCSGLPVRRSSVDDVLRLLGRGFTPGSCDDGAASDARRTYATFSWLTAQRLAGR